MSTNQQSTCSKITDAEKIAFLQNELAIMGIELKSITAQRDHVIGLLIEKNQAVIAMNDESEKKNALVDSLKMRVGELQEKLSENESELKEKNMIIEKMRITRKKTTKEKEEKIQKLKQEMKMKVQPKKQCYYKKGREVEQSGSDFSSESSGDSGLSGSSGSSTPEPTNDFEFFMTPETTKAMAYQLAEAANQNRFLESKLRVRDMEMENLKLRLRDIESLEELF